MGREAVTGRFLGSLRCGRLGCLHYEFCARWRLVAGIRPLRPYSWRTPGVHHIHRLSGHGGTVSGREAGGALAKPYGRRAAGLAPRRDISVFRPIFL